MCAAATMSSVGRIAPSMFDTCTSDTSFVLGPIIAFTACKGSSKGVRSAVLPSLLQTVEAAGVRRSLACV